MLRDYQQRTIDDLFAYFEHRTGDPLLVLPTGAGKSHIIAALCKYIVQTWPDERLMILSHVGLLLQQNLEKIRQHWPDAPAGLYCAGLGQKRAMDPITVASIQSAFRKPHIFGWRSLVLIDEAHLLSNESSSMYRQFITGLRQTNPRLKVIGLTATPFRLRSGMLIEGDDRLFTDIASEVTLTELLAAGHLSPLVSKVSLVQADLSGVEIASTGDFKQDQLEAAMDRESLTKEVLDEVFELAGDRRSWLFFCAGIKHAIHVRDALRDRGVSAETIVSDTDSAERDRIVSGFKNKSVQALTSVNALSIGFDAPNADLMAILRATTSPGLWIQMLGRGLRTAPGKRDCLVLDYTDTTERLGPLMAVRPPRSATSRGPSETIERSCLICPVCRMASTLDATECGDCGNVFRKERAVTHETTAAEIDIMAPPPEPEWLQVFGVEYAINKGKEGKPDTLKVTYRCGLSDRYSEWICFDHPAGSFPRAKAEDWWRRRYGGSFVPETVEYASKLAPAALKKPAAIRVAEEGKYWRVTAYDLRTNNSEAAGGGDPHAGADDSLSAILGGDEILF